MQQMLSAGAPIAVPAGNYAQTHNRSQTIDTVLANWANRDFPLIVVRAVNYFRWRAPFSQADDKVTVYAPGEDIECANGRKASETSYSAAMVRDMA